ncbi:MAG: holo-ACP synthase [Verrucomicrobiota bacterium]
MIDPKTIKGAVLGIGCDLVEVDRIRSMHERHGERFIERIYTPVESDYCLAFKNPYASLAARFAAKEAVSKAFGTGIGAELGWLSVSVVKDDAGAPSIVLDELGRTLLEKFHGTGVLISLSHTANLAQAYAIVVGD